MFKYEHISTATTLSYFFLDLPALGQGEIFTEKLLISSSTLWIVSE